MPELPEVETVLRGLAPVLQNNSITNVQLNRADLRIPFNSSLIEDISNSPVHRMKRRAKYILIEFENKKILVIHLGMSGVINIISSDQAYKSQKHDHVVLTLKDKTKLVYNDPRRFGMIFSIDAQEETTHKAFAHLGVEPLSNHFSGAFLKEKLGKKETSIKQALLDQKNIVGVGNIYACEALHMAKIRPTCKTSRLTKQQFENLAQAVQTVLIKAIEAGGSSLKDFRHTDGQMGYFQHNFLVYDREGQACKQCNTEKAIQRITQSGRSTFYCIACQK